MWVVEKEFELDTSLNGIDGATYLKCFLIIWKINAKKIEEFGITFLRI